MLQYWVGQRWEGPAEREKRIAEIAASGRAWNAAPRDPKLRALGGIALVLAALGITMLLAALGGLGTPILGSVFLGAGVSTWITWLAAGAVVDAIAGRSSSAKRVV